MVKKIILSIFISFAISATVFLSVMTVADKDQPHLDIQSNYYEIQEEFFLRKFDVTEEKIFIIGSSYTQALNTTEINSKLKSICANCQVYNLSIQGDTLDKRSKIVDLIIFAKPKLIIYGISESDFADFKNSEFENAPFILPDIKNLVISQINPVKYFKFLEFPSSPKDKTWNVIRQINKGDSIHDKFTPYPNSPFLTILNASTISVSELELKSLASNIQSLGIIKEPSSNEKLNFFKDMINKIQKNDIKIVLFVVPLHDYVISKQSDDYRNAFDMIKSHMINSSNIPIYPRISSYSKMPIWHDLYHISVNDQSLVYSEDILKIILEELN